MNAPNGDKCSFLMLWPIISLMTTVKRKGIAFDLIYLFCLNFLDTYIDRLYLSSICERITPRLAHANAAVVLSAVKVLMKFMEMLPSDSDFVSTLTKKLAPPLVTLLSSEPEVNKQ